MRYFLAVFGLIATIAIAGFSTNLFDVSAQTTSETDRLREALRTSAAQTRALEDQRTAMQAQLTQTQRERDDLKSEVEAAKAKVKQTEKDYRQAVREFNDRLEERNQTLEKWKEAYAEAATVAQTKDAERAKFEAEAAAFKASTNACTAKNQELVKVGRELLTRYEGVTFGDKVLAREPLTGLERVQVQNLLQTYGDKILNQVVQP
jgi:chromosome segregation ATPase